MKTLLALLFIVLTITLQSQPRGDYGDAPDTTQQIRWWGGTAKFYTLHQSQGPLHTMASTSSYWVGRSNTRPNNTTSHENDALVVDNDLDDGQPFIWVILVGIPAPATVSVPITTSIGHNPNREIYVNVLIDVDNDLDFDNYPDPNWVVQNKKVKLPADTSVWVTFGGFHFGGDLLLFPVWLRVTLTDVPVPYLWVGKGISSGWTSGETEDWWYTPGFGGGGRRPPPGGGGNNPRGRGAGGGGGGGMPAGKSHSVSMPQTVYVKCDETKCFTVTIQNTGSTPMTDISCGFSFSSGTPLPQGPSHQPPPQMPITSLAPGQSVTLVFCITGWPCLPQTEGKRWAKYTFTINYDPDNEYFQQSYEIDFRSDEDPFIDAQFNANLGLIQSCGTEQTNLWTGKINNAFRKCLTAFTGNYQGAGRWIVGRPTIFPMHIPKWASFVMTGYSADSSYYEISGTPGIHDNGLDSVVVQVLSDNPGDAHIKPYIVNIPVIIENINSAPVITQTLPQNLTLDLCKGDSLHQKIIVSDKDLNDGRRDTIFIDYSFKKEGVDGYYYPVPDPHFDDSGNGRAYMMWKPTIADTGTYELWIMAWDYYYGFDSTKCIVNVIAPSLKAEFTCDKQACYVGDAVNFSDASKCSHTNITSWDWDFGDGNNSNEQNPTHVYMAKGKYTVKLTISDGTLSSTLEMPDFIRVLEPMNVDFVADKTSGVAPLEVKFTDHSTGEIEEWLWDFGDDNSSDEQNPTHIYNAKGNYTVKLVISDIIGSVSGERYNYIEVIDPSSVDEHKAIDEFLVYPNPAEDRFTLMIKLELPTNVSVRMFDMYGREIVLLNLAAIESMSETIDISQFAPGLYLIEIKAGGEIRRERIIKKQ